MTNEVKANRRTARLRKVMSEWIPESKGQPSIEAQLGIVLAMAVTGRNLGVAVEAFAPEVERLRADLTSAKAEIDYLKAKLEARKDTDKLINDNRIMKSLLRTVRHEIEEYFTNDQ